MNWSDIVRGGPAPKKSKLNPNAAPFVPRPPCAKCGAPSEVCRRCAKLAVYQDGLCGHCFSLNMPSESMCIGYIRASNYAEQILFFCAGCSGERVMPWEPTPVSLQDILAGKRVTGEQFFEAIRRAEGK